MNPTGARALNAPIVTERLELEPLTAAHADLLFAPLQDERLYRWISSVPPASLERLRQYWQAAESRLSADGRQASLNWAVRRASDRVYVGKLDAEVDSSNVATNIGYLFFPAFHNQGFATEAVRALVSHLEHQGVTESRALVTVGNAASERVLVKCGFVRTRRIVDSDTIRGVEHDDVEYVRRAVGVMRRELT